MKRIIWLIFGVMTGAAAFGQVVVNRDTTDRHWKGFMVNRNPVSFSPVDRMPIWAPDLAKVERMPVLRMTSGDRMPVATGRQELRIEVRQKRAE